MKITKRFSLEKYTHGFKLVKDIKRKGGERRKVIIGYYPPNLRIALFHILSDFPKKKDDLISVIETIEKGVEKILVEVKKWEGPNLKKEEKESKSQ